MAKGKWEVVKTVNDGESQYRAARKLHADLGASPENEEYYGVWSPDRGAVEALVTYLNDKEAAHG